ncbi:hypothetical protein HBZC1_16880 [Helicobacter bizzozeronii CIII-1]|uniref:Uncharacterized protein n=1 Tax=Helicobacter bizzozeronii (strain CIII-1) TaxID=1002804 RepID=F8KPF0_HELBC|nr:hypothetical protein HBZC1_16880 [Helicobacter bizzozeronii CIII-1]CCF81419.1 hypothetical protein HBZS_118700 [Helicobacter bizzozeronii CCUG 35545]
MANFKIQSFNLKNLPSGFVSIPFEGWEFVSFFKFLFERHLKNLRGDCVAMALKVQKTDIELDILRLKDLGILKEVASKRFELDFSVAKG